MPTKCRLQEPGAGALFYPDLVQYEPDIMFETIPDDDNPGMVKLVARKLEEDEIDDGDRATLISKLDMDKFWAKLVDVRSRDWSGFKPRATYSEQLRTHDEL